MGSGFKILIAKFYFSNWPDPGFLRISRLIRSLLSYGVCSFSVCGLEFHPPRCRRKLPYPLFKSVELQPRETIVL